MNVIASMFDLRNTVLKRFSIIGTKFESYEHFPKHVQEFECSICAKEQGYITLSRLHELMYDTKQIVSSVVPFVDGDSAAGKLVTDALNTIPDPFEFQDWCIENGLEEFL
jgi:hypothetical protein